MECLQNKVKQKSHVEDRVSFRAQIRFFPCETLWVTLSLGLAYLPELLL